MHPVVASLAFVLPNLLRELFEPRERVWMRNHAITTQAVGLLALILTCWVATWLTRRVVLVILTRLVRKTSFKWDDVLLDAHVFRRASLFVPSILLYSGLQVLPLLATGLRTALDRLAQAAVVWVGAATAGAFLSALNRIYARMADAKSRPIKGYLQIVRIFAYLVASVLVVAILIDRSPWLFLSGLGAMTAVVILVFKDTILSLVASIQLSGNDMVRVGDWIEMPKYGADGDVIDIALHTVKVQNWDKTIVTIPTYKLIDESFKNWRGMAEAGGRRIKRALAIDMRSVRFLEDEDLQRLGRFALLEQYLADKRAELEAYNREHCADPSFEANARRLTNLGTFRAYVVAYLRHHPKIHQELTFLIRHLAPTPQGLPLEIYVFTNDTVWAHYEAIQADIFDHLLAIVPEFGLRVFQEPSGADMAALAQGIPRAR